MDLVEKVRDLCNLDSNTHWFCPRTTPGEDDIYYDEDFFGAANPESAEQKAIRLSKIDAANSRKDDYLGAAAIMAYEGEDARPYQETLQACLATQLSRCDICIRVFHRARSELRSLLEEEYPAEEIVPFMQKYDDMNHQRIVAGLNQATETLSGLPPQERSVVSAGETGMYALFEALHCKSFLNDEDLLRKAFDRPFKLVQTKKKLTLPSCAPGTASFLFSDNPDRFAWAERNLTKMKRSLMPNEFEYSLRSVIEIAAARVNVSSLELDFLPIFWRAMRIIVSKLDHHVIANHLRALDVNVYTLSLEHFQIDEVHFSDLMISYEILLEKGKFEFWDAMGTVSSQAVLETICRAPRLEQLLTSREEHEHGIATYIESHLRWVDHFIQSIPGSNLVSPLQTILTLFLHQYQKDKYSPDASAVTLIMGLTLLLEGMKKMTKEVDGGPAYAHLIETVSKNHIMAILDDLKDVGKLTKHQLSRSQHLALLIVEHLLAMDVKSLSRDRRRIEKHSEIDHEIGLSSLNVWKLTMRQIKPGQPHLVRSICSGLTGLLSVERLPPRVLKAAPRAAESWNHALNRAHGYVVNELMDRLDLFSPEQVFDLFSETGAANGIISLVFNGDGQIHQAALAMLKNFSGEDERRESVMHLLKVFLHASLAATSYSLKLVTEAQNFGPCPTVLKVCRDILSCLCDSRDGLLRSRTLSAGPEVVSLRTFWNRLWSALETMFEKTEAWSSLGHDKTTMQDFCRETMDFADTAFDQYSVLAGTIQASPETSNPGKELLKSPNKTFKGIIKWLRLRDEYLIDKAVTLTSKILGRLKDVDISISDDSAEYLEIILTTTDKNPKIRTKLTMSHKAVLRQALEKHLGRSLCEVIEIDPPAVDPPAIDPPATKKQATLADWASTNARQRNMSGSSTPIPHAAKPKDAIDLTTKSATAERQKAKDASQKKLMQKLSRLQQQKTEQIKQVQTSTFLETRKKAKAEQEKQRLAAIAKANLGAGSGVARIGNYGKDLSTLGQTVMVDDAELDTDDDDDDDLDFDEDLFGISSKPKKAQRPGLDVTGTTGLKPEVKKGPTRIQRTQRSMKDMRARLAPKLDDLHRTILGWDFFHDGDYPPGSNQHEFTAVSNSFRDPVTYKNTFGPLLTLEAWQGMAKAREDNASKPYEIKVGNRSNIDHFVEISSIVGHQENRELQLMEGDIILLSKSPKPADNPNLPHGLTRIYRVKRQKAHLEIVYQLLPNSPIAGQLMMQSVVYGLKLQSITPLEREYGALQALQYYDLCNQIVWAKPSQRISYSDRQISQTQDVYNLNRAQSEAVNAALENEGFTLIQGPPGSGKTKTIIAIVGGLLSQTLANPNKGATRISMPKANGNMNAVGDAPPKKLLVCAPSNAAVDELVMRLKDGVKTKAGSGHKINVVRLGRTEAVNFQVQDVVMDQLVSKKLGGGDEKDAQIRAANADVFKEHEHISAKIREMYSQRDSHDSGEKKLEAAERKQLDDALSHAKRRKAELGTRIDAVKDNERNKGREQELNRKRAQQAVLDEAHVICATLSGSGHDMFQSLNIEFETVVIDEAAQCVEMSSLIPLKYGCIKCIMVGDPKQLPPTVFSKEAARFQYEQSLFVRMQNNHPDEVHLLDTQYRMHPAISVFPSRTFYDGLLKDGEGMAGLRKQTWHASALLAPYRFFDVHGQHQSAPKGHSLINIAEINVAMALYDRLRTDYRNYDFAGKIGIITPYKSQLRELKNRFGQKYGADITDLIEFNTTDAFQGRESEIIIFSCVRASPAGGIGFLQDIRRMNVGLTRAKSSLWVLGNSESLVRGQYWRKLVEDARNRDCYSTGNIITLLQKPSSAFPASVSNTQSMFDINDHATQMESEMPKRALPVDRPKQISGDGGKADANRGNTANMAAPATRPTRPAQDPDKMDGVTYRFEDRAAARRVQPAPPARVPSGSNGATLAQAKADVVMEDAELDGLTLTTTNTALSLDGGRGKPSSRTDTPASNDGGRGTVSTEANGTAGAPRSAIVPPRAAPLKRKPVASVFMPKKSKR